MRSLTSHQVQVASSCLSIITQTCPAHVHSHSLVSSSFTSRLTARNLPARLLSRTPLSSFS
ncbi:hypothetical protein JI435_404250 [Parastagonospora nodorum SN15]|uniref:Uncharacterized protein n=1 Tax=Phaeosphaeria nodorum (strain SN15 / ATCC MYA-4574 / FGSC 10173) TaxID=321614 RepID=A0A7U2EV46_PHANO|nr:hypothetical protein JI435_404250 [Parastagonospora nodorum SN15]